MFCRLASASLPAGKSFFPFIFLFFFFLLLLSSLGRAKMQHRELQNEFCKHLGQLDLPKFMDPESAYHLPVPSQNWPLIPPSETITLPSKFAHHLLWSEPQSTGQLMGRLHPSWTKLVDK
jgi:hypothetical protein